MLSFLFWKQQQKTLFTNEIILKTKRENHLHFGKTNFVLLGARDIDN